MRKSHTKKKKMVLFIVIVLVFLALASELYLRYFANYCEPYFDKKTKIIRRNERTEGVYKTEYTNSGYFKINNAGWNSWRDYHSEKSPNIKRIAIVGHSNIEGLRVPVDRTLSKILEGELNKKGIPTEVYTFGCGGMHLSQALHVSRYVVKEFQPDILIIGTLLDDFIYKTTDKKFFMSLEVNDDNQIKEILPKKYIESNNSPLSFLYFSRVIKYADFRFGFGNKKMHIATKKLEELRFLKENHYTSIQDSNYEQKVILGVNYILSEFERISNHSQGSQKPLVYFIDFPHSVPSYNCHDTNPPTSMTSHRNKVLELFNNYPFTLIYPEEALMDDYYAHHQNFDFPMDAHYNEHAHFVLGCYLTYYFIENHIKKQH